MTSALIMLSGGIDSLCCTHFMMERGFDTNAVFIDYGQAAVENERKSALQVADFFKIPLEILTFRSSQSYNSGEVRGRNLFLYTTSFFGSSISSGVICSGIHSGTNYYDCSKEFHASMSNLLSEMSDGKIEAFAPFLGFQKVEVYKYALDNNLPLGLSYSCESNKLTPCGECLSCQDRRILQDLQKDAN